jgi:hypothetical protein
MKASLLYELSSVVLRDAREETDAFEAVRLLDLADELEERAVEEEERRNKADSWAEEARTERRRGEP